MRLSRAAFASVVLLTSSMVSAQAPAQRVLGDDQQVAGMATPSRPPMQAVPLAFVGSKDVETIAWTQYSTVLNGYIKLVTPIVSTQYGNMFLLTIRGYRYAYGDDPLEIRCAGYSVDWAGGLSSKKCETAGTDLPVEMSSEVRPGTTAPVVVIRIGTPTTVWNFPFFGGEYVGNSDYAASQFQFVTGETTPAAGTNTNNVVVDDQAGTVVVMKNGLPSMAVKGGDLWGAFVGVGTANPLARFHVLSQETSPLRGILLEQYSPDFIAPQFAIRKSRGTPSSPATVQSGDNLMKIELQGYDGANFIASAAIRGTVESTVSANSVPTALQFATGVTAAGVERMRITSAGKILIGSATPDANNSLLYVNGNANFAGTVTGGNIQAKYQDVAEWVPTAETLTAGTVVVLDPARANHVIASTRSYDTTVAGVISAHPGLVLGEAGDSKALVATTGRVRVCVDATDQAVSIGDLLVTSHKTGCAMKSIPIGIQGVAIHRPGTVVGKALEPLTGQQGEILVLLSLQ